jgi:ParB-like partition proteins
MKSVQQIPIKSIRTGNNDRKAFDQKALRELADSIREHGLIEPIILRKSIDGLYTLVAGERRLRACTLLGLESIPSIIADLTDEEAAAIMLAENVSRVDLDPIDEAQAYKIRIDKFSWTIEECARRAGTSKIKVQFRLKLLTLNPELQHLIRSGNLQIGYAQILSDGGLDPNRQLMAVSALRDNPRPTPGWFRNIVNQYQTQQNQANLFDDVFLVCQPVPVQIQKNDPPHPSTTTPPTIGRTKLAILKNQAAFWLSAARAWAEIGKPFKKQECEVAALAVQHAANLFISERK